MRRNILNEEEIQHINKQKAKGIERFVVYIYPSDPGQVVYFGNQKSTEHICKLMVIDTLPYMFKSQLPFPPVVLETIDIHNKKNMLKENIMLYICKEDDYVLLDDLPAITPPSQIIKSFKFHILDIVNKYLSDYGDVILNRNPVYYNRLKNSRDFLQGIKFLSNIQKNKTKSSSKDKRYKKSSKIYIFPNEIDNVLANKPICKELNINTSVFDLKSDLSITTNGVSINDNGEYIVLSDDFDVIKGLEYKVAPKSVALEYKKIFTSNFMFRVNVVGDISIKKKEARILIEKMQNCINDDTFDLYYSNEKNKSR